MRMTIDEHIKRMGDIRSNYGRWSGLGITPNEAKAFDFAIDTMRKYQQIQKIVSSKTTRLSYEDGFRQIKEVLEDGKND